MKTSFISIIIPTWRENKILARCLDSLSAQDYPQNKFEIILVSKEKISLKNEKMKKIKTIKIANGINHALARNIGIKKAKGEILAFLDDDCIAPKDWLSKGIKYFQNNRIGLIGGSIPQPKNQPLTYRFGGYLMASPFGTGFGGLRWRIGDKVKEASEIDLILANNMMRKKIFKKIQGFDNNQVPCEENHLYRKVQELGYKTLYVPEISAFHRSKPIFLPLVKKIFFYSSGRGSFIARFPQYFRFIYILPSLFLVFILAGIPLFLSSGYYIARFAWLTFFLGYFLFLLLNSLFVFFRFEKNPLLFIVVPFGTFLIHISYGLGFIKGFFRYLIGKKSAINMTSKD